MSALPNPVDIGKDFRGKVYVILDKAAKMVKIGFTTDLPKRFADIRTGSSAELKLLHHFRAGRDVELAIHRHLASERVRGEWFRLSDKTHSLLDEVFDFLAVETDDEDRHILTITEVAKIIADPTFGMDEEEAHAFVCGNNVDGR